VTAGSGSWADGYVQQVIIGGTASVLGGGTFANGAESAAFGYIYNYCSHGGDCTTKFEQVLYDWWPGYKFGTCISNGDCSFKEFTIAMVEAAPIGGEAKVATTLAEKLALEEAASGGAQGAVRIMEGRIGDPRYPENVWGKFQVIRTDYETGKNIVIHFWQNLETGIVEGAKLK